MEFKERDIDNCKDLDFDQLKELEGSIFMPDTIEMLLHINPRIDEVEYLGYSQVLGYYVVLILLANNEWIYVYEPKVNY